MRDRRPPRRPHQVTPPRARHELRAAAEQSGIHRTTITRIEANEPGVEEHSIARVLSTLDRLEQRYGMEDPRQIVNVIELPDGTRVTFTGSPEGVAESAARFLAMRCKEK